MECLHCKGRRERDRRRSAWTETGITYPGMPFLPGSAHNAASRIVKPGK